MDRQDATLDANGGAVSTEKRAVRPEWRLMRHAPDMFSFRPPPNFMRGAARGGTLTWVKETFAQAPEALVWTPALLLSLSVCVGHGIGRFAYALILPAMQEDQGWNYEIASWLNTANALGYVLGALTCLVLLRRLDAAQVFRLGLVATVCALLLTGCWRVWWWLLAMRLVAGCGAAWTLAAGARLNSGGGQ